MGGDVLRAAVGIGTLGLSEMMYYQPQAQSKAQKKAADLQQQQTMEARRIAAEQKPMEEAATLQTNTTGSVLGNLGLTVEADYSKKKPSSLGGTTAPVGLGFGSI